jgi:tetratricopeptide (TPR) repeat protein
MDNFIDEFNKFNASKPYVPASPDEVYDDEDWEIEYELIEHEDWNGLILYRQSVLRRHPDSLQAKSGLGDAYVRAGEYQKALDYLVPLHREHPDIIDIQWTILEALFGLGKNENDFSWVEKPVILRINETLLDQCYEYLRLKRKSRSLMDICNELILGGNYQDFKEEELLLALKSDKRFKVEDKGLFESEISVRRKSR